ncbi:MAG: glutaredoxin [Oscillospiraceae bacterium]|nr:glutaredoxin [Oscillospiraceae bacterium]MBP5168446.1 glutaredoxin [Oscillospiraceae bacterium]
MIIFGSKQCPDTMECLSSLSKAGTPYEFKDIADLPALKEFLKYRDTVALFDSVKANGGVGIPFIIKDDGQYSFDWTV